MSPNEVNKSLKNEALLCFDSFDGGGPEYSVTVEDTDVAVYMVSANCNNPNYDEEDGSGYTVNVIFKGIKPGTTKAVIRARSPIADNFDSVYIITVNESLEIDVTELETKEITV